MIQHSNFKLDDSTSNTLTSSEVKEVSPVKGNDRDYFEPSVSIE